MTTNELTKYAIEELSNAGWTVWRQNSGRVRNVWLAPKGTPDIIGFTKDGRFVGIEVKTGRDKIREDQRLWAKHARACGVFVSLIREAKDVAKVVEEYRMGEDA
jgi:hypothetical protein